MAIGIAFTSYNKDDDDQSPETQIVGTWQLQSGLSEGEPDELSVCEKKSELILKSDNTFTSKGYQTAN